ncbi:MAG: class I SAM-dependent methyltransferase [Candidatus Sabulitectum sp.]|nr:class I SAM-dependent methyltransferase [Candidatus Sabulitectum sp.]
MDSYSHAAKYYDHLYHFKDYSREVEFIAKIIRKCQGDGEISLLDVACGTGVHIKHFRDHYFEAEGLDLSPQLLDTAGKRNPGVRFHKGDMTCFDLHRKYSVITCLFSAIGYVKTISGLESAAKCMADHLLPGGLLIVEPWFTPDAWRPGTVHTSIVDEPDLKIVRMNTSAVAGRVSVLDLHYLIGTPVETSHEFEKHELGLFTAVEMSSAFERAELAVDFDPEGITGRGLYICRKEPSGA